METTFDHYNPITSLVALANIRTKQPVIVLFENDLSLVKKLKQLLTQMYTRMCGIEPHFIELTTVSEFRIYEESLREGGIIPELFVLDIDVPDSHSFPNSDSHQAGFNIASDLSMLALEIGDPKHTKHRPVSASALQTAPKFYYTSQPENVVQQGTDDVLVERCYSKALPEHLFVDKIYDYFEANQLMLSNAFKQMLQENNALHNAEKLTYETAGQFVLMDSFDIYLCPDENYLLESLSDPKIKRVSRKNGDNHLPERQYDLLVCFIKASKHSHQPGLSYAHYVALHQDLFDDNCLSNNNFNVVRGNLKKSIKELTGDSMQIINTKKKNAELEPLSSVNAYKLVMSALVSEKELA